MSPTDNHEGDDGRGFGTTAKSSAHGWGRSRSGSAVGHRAAVAAGDGKTFGALASRRAPMAMGSEDVRRTLEPCRPDKRVTPTRVPDR